ncbi:interferon-induced protein with tetratricopeptide repeats 5 [Xenopus laevis]|uniref:Interferon-induced protein with tetratricopeptide repeats 5 n=1 Tax=Xenopus laevis TaxID=8355 RepID=A0A8J0TDR8_XENLA|nr:interferon-induced protein with tetratricopeptide repeats 5 [Xenopus laevis]
MSDLLVKLLKLECHFTWAVDTEEVADINNIEDRLHDQIAYLLSTLRHRLYNLLAYTWYLKGGSQEAIRQVQKAEEHLQGTQSADVDIKRAVIYSNYAWLFYHSNQLSKAQSYLEKVEAIYKKFESSPEHDVLLTEIFGEQAWALLTLYGKSPERAKKCFEKVLVLDPDNPELNSGYAIVMYRLECEDNRVYATNKCKSIELLKRAVTLNEDDTVIKALLALKYLYLGQPEIGGKILEEALRQTPDSPYLLRYAGKFYRSEGRVDYAISILKKALNQTPTSSSLHQQIGLCYKQKMKMLIKSAKTAKSCYQPTNTYTSDINKAISSAVFHFEKAIELQEIVVNVYIELAFMYAKGTQFKKAEDIFQKALKLRNLTCEEKQEIHFRYALFQQHELKSESEAIRHYKEVLLIPNKTRVRSYSKNNLKDLAENKISNYPSDATGFGLLGFIYQQDAIDVYEKALELDPDNEDYFYALCYMRLSLSTD